MCAVDSSGNKKMENSETYTSYYPTVAKRSLRTVVAEENKNKDAMYNHAECEELDSQLNFGKFMLHRLLQVRPDATCLAHCSTGEKLSFGEVTAFTQRLATALARRGAGRGDTVGVATEPRVGLVPTTLAVMLTGAVVTVLELSSGRGILTHQLNLTKPKYIICSRRFWDAYSDLLKASDFIQTFISFEPIHGIELCVENLVGEGVAPFDPAPGAGDDTALISYSSGTTGKCKGVLLTHINMIARCDTTSTLYRDIIDSCQTICLHGVSQALIYQTCTFISAGKTVLCIGSNLDWDIVNKFQINVFAGTPVIVERLLDVNVDRERDVNSLKVVILTGSPLHPRNAKAFIKKYPHITLIHYYGMTELGRIAENKIMAEDLEGDITPVGYACASTAIKVVDIDSRAELGPNQRGEICILSPRLLKGYLGASTPLDDQGFFRTGDLGYYDQRNRFYLVDRQKDLLYFGWNKVCPSDLEAILLQHTAVLEAAVVGVPGGEGERPAALAVLRPGAVASSLQLCAFVNRQV